MSDTYEQLVERYLTCNGLAFVCPQFNVAYDPIQKDGGSEPDFVVLDYDAGEIVVVEVTEAANLTGLLDKVGDRNCRWFKPIVRSLHERGIVFETCPIRFLGVVREELLADLSEEDDVAFISLETVASPWSYWDERQQGLKGARYRKADAGIHSL